MRTKAERDSTGRFAKKYNYEPWDGSNWDEGILSGGRFWVWRPDHPAAISGHGWVHRHRVVWWLGGNDQPKGHDVHHKDDDRLEDHLWNLELLPRQVHTKHHMGKELVACVCQVCTTEFYLREGLVKAGRGKFCSRDCYHKSPVSDDTKDRLSKFASSRERVDHGHYASTAQVAS